MATPESTLPVSQDPPIVTVIGAVGSRQALEMFFRNLAADSGLAFLVAVHLSAKQLTELPALLRKRSDMPVVAATDGMRPISNHIYLLPAGVQATVEAQRLRLQPLPSKTKQDVAVPTHDRLLRSLAARAGAQTTVVVLSGTGTDGVAGAQQICQAGGTLLIQDPEEAAHGALPRRVYAACPRATVAAAGEIARLLVQLRGDLAEQIEPASADHATFDELYDKLLAQIAVQTGYDLSHYKAATLYRRVARRMNLTGMPNLDQYVERLAVDTQEAQALFKDSLVSVTNFFRDPDAFAMLERDCIPQLFAEKGGNDFIRVWVVGCATGQEAYSVAMQLIEYAAQMGEPPRLQLFATDLDEEAIAFARRGIYPKTIAKEIAPARLTRFFTAEDEGYRVKPEIREHILFAVHDLLKDPPFSRLDLITCRNVLIYFNRKAQKKVFEIFHYALAIDRIGREYLFLGTAESADAAPDLFAVVDKYCHLYQRRNVPTVPRTPRLPITWPTLGEQPVAQRNQSIQTPPRSLEDLYTSWSLRVHTPPRMLVNSDYEITHLFGDVRAYLQEPEGAVTQNVLQRILPDLRLDLRTALYQAFHKAERSVSRGLRIEIDGRLHLIHLHVGPVNEPGFPTEYAEVVFVADAGTDMGALTMPGEIVETDLVLVMRMEEEVMRTRDRLQMIIEEYENSSQELKSSNEELQSMNEELKSTTEELETSKEELQSMNEELSTVNQELEAKIDELHHANSDLLNLVASTDVGTLFLDKRLRLKRFTPQAADLFHLIEGDVGRPFAHLTHRIRHLALPSLAARVQEKGIRIEETVQRDDDHWYLLRIFPYRTILGEQEGIVITFVDINDLKRAESEERQRIQQQTLAQLGRQALAANGLDELFRSATRQVATVLEMEFCKVLQLLPDGKHLLLQAGVGWTEGLVGVATVPATNDSQAGYTLQAAGPVVVRDLTTETRFQGPELLLEHGARSGISVTIYGANGPYGVFGVHSRTPRTFTTSDIDFVQTAANILATTIARQQAVTALRTSEAAARRYVEMIERAYDAIIVWRPQQGIEFWNRGAEELYGYTAAEAVNRSTHELLRTEHPQTLTAIMATLEKNGEWEGELIQRAKNGDPIYISTRHQLIRGSQDESIILEINRNITGQKQAEAARRQSEEQARRHLAELEAIYNTAPIGLCVMDHELRYIRINQRLAEMNGLSAADHIGRTGRELFPDLADKSESMLRHVLAGGEPVIQVELTGELPAQPGVQHTWIESWLPLRNNEGEVVAINIVIEEITERKRMEEELRYQAYLLENVQDAIISTDLDFRIRTWNQGAEQTYGYSAAEAIGKRVSDLLETSYVHANDTPDIVRNAFLSAGRWQGEVIHPHKSGTKLFISNTTTLLRDQAGNPIGAVAVNRDINAHKVAEERLQFLAQASVILASSLDYNVTLENVARAAVPGVADWCVIDLVTDEGTIECAALTHVDPTKVHWAKALRERYPVDPAAPAGAPNVIRTGTAEFYPEITDAMLEAVAKNEEELHLLQSVGYRSVMVVPLSTHERALGAISFVSAESQRLFTEADLRMAEALGRRAAIAIENARLYQRLRQRQAELRQSERRFRSAFEQAAVGMAHLDMAGRYLRVNDRLCDILGYTRDELLQKTFMEITHPADLESDLGAMARQLSGELPIHSMEKRYLHKNGAFVWTNMTASVVFDEDGAAQYGIVVIEDISLRKAAAAALRSSEERFRAVQQTTPDGFMIFESVRDAAGTIIDFRWLYTNPAGERLVGRSHDYLVGKLMLEEIPGNREAGLFDAYVSVVETGQVWQSEFPYMADGMHHWFRTTAAQAGDGFAVSFTDVTERKEIQQALADSEARFRSTFEQAAVGMAHTDHSGRYLQVNERLCLIAGYPRAELLQKRVGDLVHPDERAYSEALNARLVSGELSSYMVEKRYIRGDGSLIWVHVTASSVQDETGAVSYRLAVVEDISARKAAEAALQELNATLEHMIAARTAELERSNRGLDQFAYMASHDLKAPLRAIDHLAGWISEDAAQLLPPASQEHLQKLRGRVRRMETLLEDLLTYSRVGRVQVATTKVALGELVDNVINLIATPNEFEITRAPEMPTITTHRAPLELVLRNLIGNAIKHHDRTPDSEPGRIHIDVVPRGDFIELSVADNGPGIAPEYHEGIFGMFQTLQPRDEIEGSGIGLAVVKRTVESLHGEVWLESELGKGATFYFTWPQKV